ncbi:60S ribosomal protein L18a-like protein isoform X2 [Canna indica]|uniref:60S ribosomal protein L18a-like protein isoform X2 n=1 Tax=Canna indica TaxID=4628 RepID=A0AAQ3K358_9LILI|nr:60S ribosomal protein L18a-like protein isoform X2 [Canna indica]
MLMTGQGSDGDRAKISAGQPPPLYGTFPPPSLPPPVAPPLAYPAVPKAPLQQPPPQPAAGYHVIPVGYQTHPCNALVDGVPMNMTEPPLPFCGIGVGWALFLAGFFLVSIPWYVGAFIFLFVAQDYREKPGLIACTVAAALTLVPVILNAFNFHVFW